MRVILSLVFFICTSLFLVSCTADAPLTPEQQSKADNLATKVNDLQVSLIEIVMKKHELKRVYDEGRLTPYEYNGAMGNLDKEIIGITTKLKDAQKAFAEAQAVGIPTWKLAMTALGAIVLRSATHLISAKVGGGNFVGMVLNFLLGGSGRREEFEPT